MSEATPSSYTGVLAVACRQGKRTQHGKPQGVVSDDQPDAREGQVGRPGVAERFAVPLKPGNAGGELSGKVGDDGVRYRPSKKSIKRMVERIHALTDRTGTWQETTKPAFDPAATLQF